MLRFAKQKIFKNLIKKRKNLPNATDWKETPKKFEK
ncbi:DUF3470 domain-containing protein [Streptococcus hyovaginalis]